MVGRIKAHKTGILAIMLFLLFVGLTIIILTQMVPKQIKLIVDGEATTCVTKSFTVEEFLEEENHDLRKEDVLSLDPEVVLNDGMEIKISKAVPFTVQADGTSKELRAVPQTVGDALAYHNVPLGADDKVTPALDKPLTEDMEITINRITFETKEVTEDIPYKTKIKNDSSLPVGTKKVVKKGVKGQARVTYRYMYSDGELVKKKAISRKVIDKPKQKLVAKSTQKTIKGKAYKKSFTVKAYSYSGGGRTAMGTSARVGAIAVDPSVIPLGTRVYVEGYGFAKAEDTGGNIKGKTIDVYKNTPGESSSWGVRHVKIYILQ